MNSRTVHSNTPRFGVGAGRETGRRGGGIFDRPWRDGITLQELLRDEGRVRGGEGRGRGSMRRGRRLGAGGLQLLGLHWSIAAHGIRIQTLLNRYKELLTITYA